MHIFWCFIQFWLYFIKFDCFVCILSKNFIDYVRWSHTVQTVRIMPRKGSKRRKNNDPGHWYTFGVSGLIRPNSEKSLRNWNNTPEPRLCVHSAQPITSNVNEMHARDKHLTELRCLESIYFFLSLSCSYCLFCNVWILCCCCFFFYTCQRCLYLRVQFRDLQIFFFRVYWR